MSSKSLETQIQYKLIEHLSSTNQELLKEIEKGKIREKEIEKVLREKETLLKEVNHRVKNNLQVVHSLLSVQINSSNSKILNSKLTEVQDRIYSISLLHNIMHASKNLSNVSLDNYLKEIIQYTVGDSSNFTINCNVISSYFEKASSLGMIIHELTMNSIKHAHNPNDPLHIHLSVINNNGLLEITYKDNGKSIDDISDLKVGFGMKLIKILLSSNKNSNLTYIISDPGLTVKFNYYLD